MGFPVVVSFLLKVVIRALKFGRQSLGVSIVADDIDEGSQWTSVGL